MQGSIPLRPSLNSNAAGQSWRELTAAAAQLNALFDAAGLPSGTRIGVLLRNHGPMVPLLMALFSGERCLASINASAPDDKLADDIRRAAVPVLVALRDDWARPGIIAAALRGSGSGGLFSATALR